LSHQHRPPEEVTSLLEGELAVCAGGGHGVGLIRLERIEPADLDDLLRRPLTEIAARKPFAITTNFDPAVAGSDDTIHRRYPAPARVDAELRLIGRIAGKENDLDYPCSMRFSLSGDKVE
jgi:hypothetical protein